jgi:hypothetical protein
MLPPAQKLCDDKPVIIAVGAGITVIRVGTEVAEQPLLLVTVTE